MSLLGAERMWKHPVHEADAFIRMQLVSCEHDMRGRALLGHLEAFPHQVDI